MLTTLSKPQELHNRLVESIGLTKRGFVVIGRLLFELQKNESYKEAIGAGIDTWDDYLAQPEIGLSRGEASRLTQIYETFIVKFGLDESYVSSIPIKNLHYLLPIAKDKNKNSLSELIEDAKNLSQKDFRERVYEAKTSSQERTYEYLIMKRCVETGGLSRVHEFSSEDVDTMIQRFKDVI